MQENVAVLCMFGHLCLITVGLLVTSEAIQKAYPELGVLWWMLS